MKINGIDESELEFYTTVTKRPVLPEPKIVQAEIAVQDGNFDFTEVNADGRTHYKNRTVEFIIYFEGKNREDMPVRQQRLMRWLGQRTMEIVFDDMPLIVWMGRIKQALEVTLSAMTYHELTIAAECTPFNRLEFGTEGPELDSDLELDSDIELDELEKYTFSVSGTKTVDVPHYGDWYRKPLIQVSGSFSSVEISVGGRTLEFTNTNSVSAIEIDCNKERVLSGAVNLTADSSGSFLELNGGHNEVKLECAGGTATVTFYFTHTYLFGADPLEFLRDE